MKRCLGPLSSLVEAAESGEERSAAFRVLATAFNKQDEDWEEALAALTGLLSDFLDVLRLCAFFLVPCRAY